MGFNTKFGCSILILSFSKIGQLSWYIYAYMVLTALYGHHIQIYFFSSLSQPEVSIQLNCLFCQFYSVQQCFQLQNIFAFIPYWLTKWLIASLSSTCTCVGFSLKTPTCFFSKNTQNTPYNYNFYHDFLSPPPIMFLDISLYNFVAMGLATVSSMASTCVSV